MHSLSRHAHKTLASIVCISIHCIVFIVCISIHVFYGTSCQKECPYMVFAVSRGHPVMTTPMGR